MLARRLVPWSVAAAVLASGCGLLLDLDPRVTATPPRSFLCEAQVFRDIGSEFTEEWRAWVFAATPEDGETACRAKLAEYITRAMAPGFLWQTRGLRVTEGTDADPDPLLRKKPASECAMDATGPPFTTGGPLGADVVLERPSAAEAGVSVFATVDGSVFFATPAVDLVVWRLAERHGSPGRSFPFPYRRLERHLRSFDVLIQVVTPFALGPVRIDELYVQSVGTTYAERGLGPGTWFLDSGNRAKLFFFGRGSLDGDRETSSFCIAGSGAPPFHAFQGSGPGFSLSLFLTSSDLDGLPLSVSIALGGGPPFPLAASRHQPFVDLASRSTDALAVDLGGDAADVFLDNDGDLSRVLWFEDFETTSEIYWGAGLPLSVRLLPGSHEITAVAYDSRGTYNFDTATLDVGEPIAVDDMYATDEDTTLEVPAPGVLSNDTDAGVPRSALPVTGPTHGSLGLLPSGAFRYEPDPNFFGMDGFSYRVDHDGLVFTNTASVEITVVELPPQEELERTADLCTALMTAGILNRGQTRSCRATLEEAIAELDRGGITSACNKIRAFISHIESLVGEGALSAAEAEPLLDRARNVRLELGCD